MTLLRRLVNWFGNPAEPRSAVVEEIEPRILYSADLNPALWASDASAMVADLHAVDAAAPVVAAEQQQVRRHEIVFVDAAVSDAQKLIDGVLAARGADTQIEIVQISAGADGLAQISNVLAGEHDLNAIHIISHGGPGSLRLGNGSVDAQALGKHADALAAWRAALTDDADILLYGCNVGEGTTGQSFVAQLAAATGADVAASDDATGAAALGGNWALEVQVGSIATLNPFAMPTPPQWQGLLTTYTVTNTNNSGADRCGRPSSTRTRMPGPTRSSSASPAPAFRRSRLRRHCLR